MKSSSRFKDPPRPLNKDLNSLNKAAQREDAATLASKLQLQEQRRELVCSFLALVMKLGLLSLGFVSLLAIKLIFP